MFEHIKINKDPIKFQSIKVTIVFKVCCFCLKYAANKITATENWNLPAQLLNLRNRYFKNIEHTIECSTSIILSAFATVDQSASY